MTFAQCVLRFPPISIKRGTEDVHRRLPSKFRENRPKKDRTFRRDINASTVKQYDILNVNNALVKPVYYVIGYDIVILLTLRGGTCLLSVCSDLCTVTTRRYDEERSCQHHRLTAVTTTE